MFLSLFKSIKKHFQVWSSVCESCGSRGGNSGTTSPDPEMHEEEKKWEEKKENSSNICTTLVEEHLYCQTNMFRLEAFSWIKMFFMLKLLLEGFFFCHLRFQETTSVWGCYSQDRSAITVAVNRVAREQLIPLSSCVTDTRQLTHDLQKPTKPCYFWHLLYLLPHCTVLVHVRWSESPPLQQKKSRLYHCLLFLNPISPVLWSAQLVGS